MLNTEQRTDAVIRRSQMMKRRNTELYAKISGFTAIAASFVLAVACAVFIPDIISEKAISNVQGAGSIFTGNGFISYIIIGVISFLLGISATMFCVLMKKSIRIKRKK